MSEKSKKFINYSPVGILSYPRLNKPDEFRGKSFFKTTLVLDPANEDVKEFMEKLGAHVLSKLNKGDYSPVKTNEEGKIEIVVKRKSDFGPPKFFQSTGEKSAELLEKAPGLIWGGTEASVSFTAHHYEGGVSFALAGVTIHKLVEPEKQEEAPVAPAAKKKVENIFKK